jgi:thiol-disulfide isomerase/thioredoxin
VLGLKDLSGQQHTLDNYLVFVHKHRNFSRKGAKTPRNKFMIFYINLSYNFSIFASWRDLFFMDGHYLGQVVLLNFWASWCPPCLIEMPSMQRLKQALPDTPFSILAVNSKESKGKAWRFQRMLNVNFTVLLDKTGQAAEDWNIAVYPTSYLIDPSGHIRYMVYGALEWDSDAVRQVINDLLKESAGAGS